ncbi:hypothetical protein R1sor_019400 [Riccia sorocarpa]|uniref:Uncharacterized protein n=1 Tax=Riccia sorocarpa TaxID=122646 RepID=A0ABD3ICF4_9MARC
MAGGVDSTAALDSQEAFILLSQLQANNSLIEKLLGKSTQVQPAGSQTTSEGKNKVGHSPTTPNVHSIGGQLGWQLGANPTLQLNATSLVSPNEAHLGSNGPASISPRATQAGGTQIPVSPVELGTRNVSFRRPTPATNFSQSTALPVATPLSNANVAAGTSATPSSQPASKNGEPGPHATQTPGDELKAAKEKAEAYRAEHEAAKDGADHIHAEQPDPEQPRSKKKRPGPATPAGVESTNGYAALVDLESDDDQLVDTAEVAEPSLDLNVTILQEIGSDMEDTDSLEATSSTLQLENPDREEDMVMEVLEPSPTDKPEAGGGAGQNSGQAEVETTALQLIETQITHKQIEEELP